MKLLRLLPLLLFCCCAFGEMTKEQVEAYRKAAEQGNADTQALLGGIYADGKGVPEDDVEAVKWFRKAAEHGDAGAQLFLGDCYVTGEGVQKDMVEAVKWFRKAAEQGSAGATPLGSPL